MAEHSLWVERYRPTQLENYVGNEHLKAKVERYIKSNDVPHLLLYGRAGTGKTTLAKLKLWKNIQFRVKTKIEFINRPSIID